MLPKASPDCHAVYNNVPAHHRGDVRGRSASGKRPVAKDRSTRNGDPIALFNDRGRAVARARVTADVPPGLVWMRDGWVAVNRLTSNDACLSPAAAGALPIPGGQATYEALIEVRRLAERSDTAAAVG